MLDIKVLVQNQEAIQANLYKRNNPVDLAPIIDLYHRHKYFLQQVEEATASRNRVTKEIGVVKRRNGDVSSLQEEARQFSSQIETCTSAERVLAEDLRYKLLRLPNILQDSVPTGHDEQDNITIATVGDLPTFSFNPKTHDVLGVCLGIIDFQRASKLSGSRFSVLRGAGALLERALINFFLDQHTGHGYLEVATPYLVTSETMTGTGQLPKFEEDLFKVQGSDLYLIPTAEVPVTNLHADETLLEKDLPLKYCAATPCFRSEAGSHGRDVKGLIRQHQFNKVELVQIVHPDRSQEVHESLTCDAESLLQMLELPYRKILLCSGDTGHGSSKTYDLEVWMPGQDKYREISSCSNFLDYQARRANIRFRPLEGGKPKYVHTLNGSGLAVGRTMVAILENYQQEDGFIVVPKVLRSYMHTDVIR